MSVLLTQACFQAAGIWTTLASSLLTFWVFWPNLERSLSNWVSVLFPNSVPCSQKALASFSMPQCLLGPPFPEDQSSTLFSSVLSQILTGVPAQEQRTHTFTGTICQGLHASPPPEFPLPCCSSTFRHGPPGAVPTQGAVLPGPSLTPPAILSNVHHGSYDTKATVPKPHPLNPAVHR